MKKIAFFIIIFTIISCMFISCSKESEIPLRNDGSIIVINKTNNSVYVHYSAVDKSKLSKNEILQSQKVEGTNVKLERGEKITYGFGMDVYTRDRNYAPAIFVSTNQDTWEWEIYDEDFFYGMTITVEIEKNTDSYYKFKQYISLDEYDGFTELHKDEEPDGSIEITNETNTEYYIELLAFNDNLIPKALSKRTKITKGTTKEIKYYLKDLKESSALKPAISFFYPSSSFKTEYINVNKDDLPSSITIKSTDDGIVYSFQ